MIIDDYGNLTFSSKDLIREIYKGNLDKINHAKMFVDDQDYIKYLEFIKNNALYDWPIPSINDVLVKDINEFDKENQSTWFMPDEYKNFAIEDYLLELCKTEIERSRVELELSLFRENNMIDLLKYLKFLVDILRENNILWGVGRGSSVASYSLFLIGIHKIDSIKYELDIREFLR